MSRAELQSSNSGITVMRSRKTSGSIGKRSSGTAYVFVAGLLLTVCFYLVAPRVPGTTEFVRRYFCSHPLEYISTGMFFIGLGILWSKWRVLRGERSALGLIHPLTESDRLSSPLATTAEAVADLSEWSEQNRAAVGSTTLWRRISETLHYVGGRQEGSLEEHLRYLAELAADRLHQSYALMRTISWAIPILGFLGTVIGITMAIANVTPEQLDSSLPEVTGGLAVAFDTTAQALGMSIALVFGAFLVERGEQSILNDVEQFGIDYLLSWLSAAEQSARSVHDSSVADVADWTENLLRQQTHSWGQHLNALQSGWTSALAAQTEQLSVALDNETQSTLKIHRDSVSDASDAYRDALENSTQLFARQMQRSLDAFAVRVDAWQNALQASSLAAAQQSEELHCLGRTLLQLTESEQRLTQLQQQLNDNIQGLRIVETLEQTVSSLNAAVNVMTAKTQLRSAA